MPLRLRLLGLAFMLAPALCIARAQIDVTRSPGEDIGAKINASAASCAAKSPCRITIPTGQQFSFTHTIDFIPNETVECPRSSLINNSGSPSPDVQLNYTGSAIAITMNQSGGRFVGCSLNLGPNAAEGIRIGGGSNQVRDAGISGGGPNTKLVHISGNGTEDNHLVDSRVSNFTGKGVYVDHANDTFLTDDLVYGVVGNTTGVSLTIDTAAGGTAISNFSGGNSGAHGLIVQNTLGGRPPTWIFANSFLSDLSASDGWLFDASLGSSNIGATFINSWSAGSGGAGIRISGGAIIYIGGGTKIRSNALDGILIDSRNVVDLKIEGNEILGNNTQYPKDPRTPYSGIRVTAHLESLSVNNNTIGNTPEVNGNQFYAFYSSSDIDNVNFSHNNCAHNRSSCLNTAAIASSKLTAIGNTSESEEALLNHFPSPIEANVRGIGGAYLMPYINANLVGLGGNLFFDGKNYRIPTDGGSNAAFGLLGSYASGASCIYAIPTSAPSSAQTLSPSALQKFCTLSIAPNTVSSPAAIDSGGGFKVNGIPGFTGTKTVGSCVITIQGGIITNITGC